MCRISLRNFIKCLLFALFITLLTGCGNSNPDTLPQNETVEDSESDSFQTGMVENHEPLKGVWDGNYYINSIGERMDFGISTEEISVNISGLKKEYTFLWLSDLHIITENDEIAVEDLETVVGRRESFKNTVGMYSDEFWLQLSHRTE